ncbi:MAG: hypothetical protein K6L81_14335 [Agarilytica sp.]
MGIDDPHAQTDIVIDLNVIHEEYDIALNHCRAVLSENKWVVQPAAIELTRHKTKFGMASSKGVVYVNVGFIGTHAISKLRNTLRHELAHLAVGLAEGHNAIFKHCALAFGVSKEVPKSEIQAFEQSVGYKWQLIAHLVDGRTVEMGRVHRRHKKYSTYTHKRWRYMVIKDTAVKRFEYVAV